MRIALVANSFFPSVGGYETVARILAKGFSCAGNEVCVITNSPGPASLKEGYSIRRNPSPADLIRSFLWADVIVQNSISIPNLLPALCLARPLFVIHHGWYSQHASGILNWKGQMKFLASKWCRNISVSTAVASQLGTDSHVIGNPYDDAVFRQIPSTTRRTGAMFVGRLVSDKGCDTLIEAIRIAATRGHEIGLRIIGAGPEETELRRRIQAYGLSPQITLLGAQPPEAIANLMNHASVVVIPSRWAEPFGVVALEALACGCNVIATRTGGLPEATGGCAELVNVDNPHELADVLIATIDRPINTDQRSRTAAHLTKHSSAAVISAYLEHIRCEIKQKP